MKKWTVKYAAVSLAIVGLALCAATFGAPSANAQYNAQYAPPNSQSPNAPPPPYANGSDPNAPPPPDGQSNGNAPSQAETDAGAGRISFIHGDVSTQRGDSGETSAATLNVPLVSGDKISTGDASRTEIQLDYANILRLDSNAQANITTLSRAAIQIELAVGLANYSQFKDSDANAEIDTPNVAVHPSREGRYRILVTPDGETDVIVRDGEADISTSQGNTKVRKGDLITIIGSGNDTQYKITKALPEDDFDNWNKSRDDLILHSGGRERTNPYYTGTQDLDQYGVWSEVPDYGNVWIPTVTSGWAPYRAGRWVYEPVWGWTWVSVEPWGWAPYHYGRWFLYGNSWAWWPGPVYGGYRPIWAPAYVSFFGFGRGGFGVGFGFGSVGWLPIGPGDYFHPWWGGYRGRFGVTAVGGFRDGFAPLHPGGGFSNVRDVAVNDRLRAGVSSVRAGDFGRGNVAARGVSPSEFGGARMMTGNVPINPSRESLRGSDRPASPTAFTGRGASQHFFSSRSAGMQGGFSQGARPSFDRGGAQGGVQQAERGQTAPGFQRFSPQSNARPSAGNMRGAQPGYRPPLDMSKPIVNQRSAPAFNRSNRPGNAGSSVPAYRQNAPPTYRPAPSNGGSPSYRGGSAPTYRSSPSPGASREGGGSRGGSSRSSGGSHGHR